MATLTVSQIITNIATPPIESTSSAISLAGYNILTESAPLPSVDTHIPDLPPNPNVDCDAASINSTATRNEPNRVHDARQAADRIALGCGGLGRRQRYPKQSCCSRHRQATASLGPSLGREVGRWVSGTGIVTGVVRDTTTAMGTGTNPAGSIRKAKKWLGLDRLWGSVRNGFPAGGDGGREEEGARVETLGGKHWSEKVEGGTPHDEDVEMVDVADVGAWVLTGNGGEDKGKAATDEDDDEVKGTQYDGTLDSRATPSEMWSTMTEGGSEQMSSKQHRHRFGFIKRPAKETTADQPSSGGGPSRKRGPALTLPGRLRKRLMSSGKLRRGFGHTSPPTTELPGGQTVGVVPTSGL